MQNRSGDMKRNHKQANRVVITKDRNIIIKKTDFFVLVEVETGQALRYLVRAVSFQFSFVFINGSCNNVTTYNYE